MPIMITGFVILTAWIFNIGGCLDINGVDVNQLEFSPFYDAIIFSDIAEVINDIGNNMNFKTDTQANSESDSDEDIENLLSEYQQHLERAQKERVKYIEKTKGKNKVPRFKHEKFSKLNFPKIHSYDKNRNYYSDDIETTQKVFKNPYDLFTPLRFRHEGTLPTFNKLFWGESKMGDIPSTMRRSNINAIPSSCFCEENTFPCKCNCKQCLIPLGETHTTLFEPLKSFTVADPLINNNSLKNLGQLNEKTGDILDNNVNIRIKVDIQMPKNDRVFKNIFKYLNPILEDEFSEPTTLANVSFPSFNFPIPHNIFEHGFSKFYQNDYAPIHKITSHKKKKPHSSYQNKKHRSKYLTFHHGKGGNYKTLWTREKYDNYNENLNKTLQDAQDKIKLNITQVLEPNTTENIPTTFRMDNYTLADNSVLVNISSDDNLIDVETTTQDILNINTTKSAQNNTAVTPQFTSTFPH